MDIKRLMDEADARTVAEFLGMQIVKKGKYDFIQCPGHEKRLGKPDSHIGNAVLLKNGYKCFACNTFIPTAEMVMEYTGCNRQKLTISLPRLWAEKSFILMRERQRRIFQN